MTNPHALTDYNYGCGDWDKVNRMVIALRMLAPEWEISRFPYCVEQGALHWAIRVGFPGGGSDTALINWETMEIVPYLIIRLNTYRKRQPHKIVANHQGEPPW